MQEFPVKWIKILMIIAIIFCFLSLILPWGSWSYSFRGKTEDMNLDMYLWGMYSGDHDEWFIYLNLPDTSDFEPKVQSYDFVLSSDIEEPEPGDLIIFLLAMFILLPLFIFSIILSLFAYRKIGRKHSILSLTIGVVIVICLIINSMYLTSFVNLVNESIIYGGSFEINFSFGFYFAIFSLVIFFIVFIMQRTVPITKKNSDSYSKKYPVSLRFLS